MKNGNEVLVIDAGNTQIKVAVFQEFDLQEVQSFSNEQLESLKNYLHAFKKNDAIIASVRSERNTKWLHQLLPKAKRFNVLDELPITISYATPETLGADRVANAIAAFHQCKSACLIIDLGTCVKYDLVDATGSYLGGGISPGIQMRFKAMHTFTGKLPLITDTETPKSIGTTTIESMTTGVLHGVQYEIEGFITKYKTVFPELTIFLTGGDHRYFDIGVKNGIFADENLTLKGLLITLMHAHTR